MKDTFPSPFHNVLPGSGRGQAAVDAVVGKLGSGVDGRVKLLLLDVTSQQSVDQAFQTVSAEHGTIFGVISLNADGQQQHIISYL